MSHFTVLITNTDKKDVETQLSPFDENREMPMHISKTKADLIAEGRKDFERAKEKYDKWQADTEAYEKDCSNPRHLEWLKNEVPAMIQALANNDEDAFYKKATQWYETDDFDKDGNYITTNNDDAKWDWYQVGGRWSGHFIPKENATSGEKGEDDWMTTIRVAAGAEKPTAGCDIIKVKDIDWDAMDQAEKDRRGKHYDEQMTEPEDRRFVWERDREDLLKMSREQYINRPIHHSTFAVLHNGKWYERGEMGWWAVVSNEKPEEQWDEEFKKLLDSLDPGTEVTLVDCHI